MFQERGLHVEKWTILFSRAVRKLQESQLIKRKVTDINEKKVMTAWVVKPKKSFFTGHPVNIPTEQTTIGQSRSNSHLNTFGRTKTIFTIFNEFSRSFSLFYIYASMNFIIGVIIFALNVLVNLYISYQACFSSKMTQIDNCGRGIRGHMEKCNPNDIIKGARL